MLPEAVRLSTPNRHDTLAGPAIPSLRVHECVCITLDISSQSEWAEAGQHCSLRIFNQGQRAVSMCEEPKSCSY